MTDQTKSELVQALEQQAAEIEALQKQLAFASQDFVVNAAGQLEPSGESPSRYEQLQQQLAKAEATLRQGDAFYICDSCGIIKWDRYTLSDGRFCDCPKEVNSVIPRLRLLTIGDIKNIQQQLAKAEAVIDIVDAHGLMDSSDYMQAKAEYDANREAGK